MPLLTLSLRLECPLSLVTRQVSTHPSRPAGELRCPMSPLPQPSLFQCSCGRHSMPVAGVLSQGSMVALGIPASVPSLQSHSTQAQMQREVCPQHNLQAKGDSSD